MCCLRLKQLPRASKHVWKKLKRSTKSLHKLLSFGKKQPKKLPANKQVYQYHHHGEKRSKKQALLSFLSPRQSHHLKKRKKSQNYYLSTRQPPPIFIDDLFRDCAQSMEVSTAVVAASSLSVLNVAVDKEGEDHEEGVMVEGDGGMELTSPSMGIDERAEIFITSFRAELDRSFRKW